MWAKRLRGECGYFMSPLLLVRVDKGEERTGECG
jgi:hypothetical protein